MQPRRSYLPLRIETDNPSATVKSDRPDPSRRNGIPVTVLACESNDLSHILRTWLQVAWNHQGGHYIVERHELNSRPGMGSPYSSDHLATPSVLALDELIEKFTESGGGRLYAKSLGKVVGNSSLFFVSNGGDRSGLLWIEASYRNSKKAFGFFEHRLFVTEFGLHYSALELPMTVGSALAAKEALDPLDSSGGLAKDLASAGLVLDNVQPYNSLSLTRIVGNMHRSAIGRVNQIIGSLDADKFRAIELHSDVTEISSAEGKTHTWLSATLQYGKSPVLVQNIMGRDDIVSKSISFTAQPTLTAEAIAALSSYGSEVEKRVNNLKATRKGARIQPAIISQAPYNPEIHGKLTPYVAPVRGIAAIVALLRERAGAVWTREPII